MRNDLQVSVNSPEAARSLQEDFDELLARVNGDMMFQSMNPADPVSVEAAITVAERSIDSHLLEFTQNPTLQSLRNDIQQRFRSAIQQQASGSNR